MPPKTANLIRHRNITHAERLAVLETWKADHEDRCRERYEGLSCDIIDLKDAANKQAQATFQVMDGLNDMKAAFGVRAVEHSDGSKTVKTKLLKLDLKFVMGGLTSLGGAILLYQIMAPTLAAMALALHRAIMGHSG